MSDDELPIIQATYDLIKWYVPLLNRLPRAHKYGLGDRLVSNLYDLLEGLITARYAREKHEILQALTGTPQPSQPRSPKRLLASR